MVAKRYVCTLIIVACSWGLSRNKDGGGLGATQGSVHWKINSTSQWTRGSVLVVSWKDCLTCRAWTNFSCHGLSFF